MKLHLLYFALIGLAFGWLAVRVLRNRGFGLLGNAIVGIAGAVLGGLIAGKQPVLPIGHLPNQIIFAAIGSVFLLLLTKFMFGGDTEKEDGQPDEQTYPG